MWPTRSFTAFLVVTAITTTLITGCNSNPVTSVKNGIQNTFSDKAAQTVSPASGNESSGGLMSAFEEIEEKEGDGWGEGKGVFNYKIPPMEYQVGYSRIEDLGLETRITEDEFYYACDAMKEKMRSGGKIASIDKIVDRTIEKFKQKYAEQLSASE